MAMDRTEKKIHTVYETQSEYETQTTRQKQEGALTGFFTNLKKIPGHTGIWKWEMIMKKSGWRFGLL